MHLCIVVNAVCFILLAQTVLTGNLNVPRAGSVATLLADGRVLVTGGFNASGDLATAEVFDPATSRFTRIADMNAPHSHHTATALPNGDVLILGDSAEIFDGARFVVLGAFPRRSHTATLLRDGRVLIAGGISGDTVLAEAQIFDPATRSFEAAGSMTTPRFDHGTALLPDGRVLIAGGYSTNSNRGFAVSAEIFDPRTKTFTATATPFGPHTGDIATLANGDLLLVGIDDPPVASSSSEIFDGATFRPAMPVWSARWGATSTMLPNGTIVVAGGGHFYTTNDLSTFDAASQSYRSLGALQIARSEHAAIVLRDGRLLIIGGQDQGTINATGESLGAAAKTGRHRAAR
jgi:hypothetical protein